MEQKTSEQLYALLCKFPQITSDFGSLDQSDTLYTVQNLLNNGANPNYKPQEDSLTPLELAALTFRGDLVKTLLENGADATQGFPIWRAMEKLSGLDWTQPQPIMSTTFLRDQVVQTINLLTQNGGLKTAYPNGKCSPLDLACSISRQPKLIDHTNVSRAIKQLLLDYEQ